MVLPFFIEDSKIACHVICLPKYITIVSGGAPALFRRREVSSRMRVTDERSRNTPAPGTSHTMDLWLLISMPFAFARRSAARAHFLRLDSRAASTGAQGLLNASLSPSFGC